ncbi:MAG: type IV pilus assembly protein PilM [Nitrospinota bacterium]
MIFGRAPRPAVGLDIGSHAVKLVQLESRRGSLALRRLGMAPVAPGAIEGGEVRDHEAVMEAVESLWERERVGTKQVVASLSGPGAVAVPLRVPPMGKMELAASLPAEAEQYLPFEPEEARLSYAVIGETIQEDRRCLEVLLVAVRRGQARELADLLRQLGLEPIALDLNFLALERAYELLGVGPHEGAVALVDVGGQFTLLHILRGGRSTERQTLFTRTIPWGGERLTGLLGKGLGVSAEVAEAIKVGRSEPPESVHRTKDSVRAILQEGLEGLAHELGRSFQFLGELSPDVRLERLVLSGGGSLLLGLERYLAESLGVHAERFDPFETVAVDEKLVDPDFVCEVATAMGVAAGLALRGIRGRPRPGGPVGGAR